jgi:antitoxin (DNA-binding transcriptional repressor) of toxin-antitoxin stability system
MERAAAGETFNVTRRGKPYVRLTGPDGQLDLAGSESVASLAGYRAARITLAEVKAALGEAA